MFRTFLAIFWISLKFTGFFGRIYVFLLGIFWNIFRIFLVPGNLTITRNRLEKHSKKIHLESGVIVFSMFRYKNKFVGFWWLCIFMTTKKVIILLLWFFDFFGYDFDLKNDISKLRRIFKPILVKFSVRLPHPRFYWKILYISGKSTCLKPVKLIWYIHANFDFRQK